RRSKHQKRCSNTHRPQETQINGSTSRFFRRLLEGLIGAGAIATGVGTAVTIGAPILAGVAIAYATKYFLTSNTTQPTLVSDACVAAPPSIVNQAAAAEHQTTSFSFSSDALTVASASTSAAP